MLRSWPAAVSAVYRWVVRRFGLVGHSYADDTQVYISAPDTSSSTVVQHFVSCIEQIDARMSSNRLKMNADKTQLIWLSTKQQLDKLSTSELDLLSARVRFSTVVSDLGVLVDNQLSMADHVAALSRACLFQLRQLHLLRLSLTEELAKTLVHTFFSSCLDYCATVYYTVSATSCCRSYRSHRTRPPEW